MRAEISYDLVMDADDMAFIEGSFRLPGGEWQVVIVARHEVHKPVVVSQVFDSGVRGMFVQFPHATPLNAAAIQRALSAALGVSEWVVVRGPDSLRLR